MIRLLTRFSAALLMFGVLNGALCAGPLNQPVGLRVPLPSSLAEISTIDTDGDEVNDETDNCPTVSNEGQEDADGDDIGDACEGTAISTLPQVRVRTTMGNFVIELNDVLAPISVANFLQYVDDGFYTDTIFHRVDTGNHVIQTGGFTADLTAKPNRDPIISESGNGLLNDRTTVGMARTSDPDSARSQWYVNTQDNPGFDPAQNPPGFTVFGRVIAGMSIVDDIQAVPTQNQGNFNDVPVSPITIISVDRL